MDLSIENDAEKLEIKGARKRKSATITRIIQNLEKIENETEINIASTEIEQIHQTNSFQNLTSKKSKNIPKPPEAQEPLKEPTERITLIQRTLGTFNNITDDQKTPLNVSIVNGPPFTCIICKSWFFFGNKLKLHYYINHNRFHCEICGTLFNTKDEKESHLQNSHNILQCEICQDEISRYDIWFHYEQDHDAISCYFCSNILYPKSCYQGHIQKYHKINNNYKETTPISEFKVGDQNFYCYLCVKNREIGTFYGHMISHHKVGTTQLMNIMINYSLNLTIDGTTVEERSTDISAVEEIVPIENPRKISKSSCKICKITYDDKIQSKFHNVYCLQKIQCVYCYAVFENTHFRDKHYKKNHFNFKCTYCKNIDVETEDLLNEHLLICHDVINCRYCEDILPKDNYNTHLSENHNYKATLMENFTDSLYEVTKIQNENIVLCCLCEKDITALIDNINSIYDHFYIEHSVSVKKIHRLITSKPALSDYDNFYKEIDSSIQNDNNPKEKDFSEDSQESNNKENKSHNEKITIKEKDKAELETDLDYENVEGNIDSDDETNLFNCDICEIEDINLLDFIIHLKEKHRLTTNYKEYECKICTELLLSDNEINKHVIETHSVNQYSVETYECGCDEKPFICFAREHVLQNHNVDEEKHHINALGYKCRFCDMLFWKKLEQNEHEVLEHFKENEFSFIRCPLCLNIFGNQYCLKQHVEENHSNYSKYTKFSYKCRLCTTVYPNISLLREHFIDLHPTMKLYCCPIPNCYKHYKMAKNVKFHLKKPHINVNPDSFDVSPCDTCGVQLKSQRSMSVHMVVKHRREKLGYMCKICQERFQTAEQRKLHVATTHPGKHEFCCSECGKSFNSKSGLNGHRNSVHSAQTVSKCPYCQKEFMRKDTYQEHLLIHTGPKHQCPHCPKSFTQRSNLIRHIRIHTGEKPYQCNYCTKTFSDQGARRSHERMHTAEEHCQCTECGKTFTKWQKLKYHMKIHTGEGLVTCEICDKKFTNNYGLRVHLETHSKETGVTCECGRTFSKEKYLQKHKEYMHGPERKKFTCPICFKKLNARTKTAQQDHMLTHTINKRFMCLICNKACRTKRTIRKHIILKHNIENNDVNNHIQKLNITEDNVNLNELLDEATMLQVDIVELENQLNEPSDDVQIKTEPLSEDEMANYDDDDDVSDDIDDDDDEDADFVIKGVKTKVENTQRSSSRTKNNPKLYNYDSFSDDDI